MSIINFINSWLKDIVVLFIIISLVDLIMPKGNMKRYIDFVIGLLIIFTVVNPFFKLTKLNFDLSQEVFNNSNNRVKDNDYFLDTYDEQVESIYKSKIKEEVSQIISENSNYTLEDIFLDIETRVEDFGFINSMKIYIYEKGDIANRENQIVVEGIKPIDLSKKIEPTVMDNQETFYDLIDMVSNKLGVDKNSIDIFKNRKGE